MGSLSSPIQLVLSSGMKAGFHCETAIYVGRSVSAEAQLDLEPFLRCSSAWTAGEEAKKKTLPRISVAERHQCSWEHHAPADPTLLGGWSLALIGNASGKTLRVGRRSRPEAFSIKETRRKPLVFAADAVRYGI